MSELPEGYRLVPPEDRAKAQTLIEKGKAVSGTGNYDYAIEMYIAALTLDPDAIDAHQELRDIAMKRKVSGGKSKGWGLSFSFKRDPDEKKNMLAAEKSLAFDPGNTDHMKELLQSAYNAGYYDTVMWIGPLFQKANLEQKKPDFHKFIILRDVYKGLEQWRLAADACQCAFQMRPLDMDLNTEMKNLLAQSTISSAKYDKPGSFRTKILDREKQDRLQKGEKDYLDEEAHKSLIDAAAADFKADPTDPGKFSKYIESLEKTDDPEHENRAIELLEQWFEKTRQFRYRQRVGLIHMRQYARMEKEKRKAINGDPTNEALKKEYFEFKKEQNEFELKEYELAVQAYPTDMKARFEVAKRLFALQRFSDAIPVFQAARNDPKFRIDAAILLGRCFLESGYVDEASETLVTLTREYQVTGDTRSKEMYYWLGRALEMKNMKQEALAAFSKVAQWDFNYYDVQARIKKLRG